MGRTSTTTAKGGQGVAGPKRSTHPPAGKTPQSRSINKSLAVIVSTHFALELAAMAPKEQGYRWSAEAAEQSNAYAVALSALHKATRMLPDDYEEVVAAVDWLADHRKASEITTSDKDQFDGAHEVLLSGLLREQAAKYRALFP